jgi:hypothetical protein
VRAAARRLSHVAGKPAAGIGAGHDDSGRPASNDGDVTMQRTTRLCSLETAVGKTAECPEDACPFWEPGGAALGGRCAFEQLGVTADEGLAAWLLEIRGRLESARSVEDERALRSAFHHLLNSSRE